MNINTASRLTGISKDMIRFYEKKGIIHPSRKENGYRDYTDHDVFILVMARQYSCLGIDLSSIAGLLNNDKNDFQSNLSKAVTDLEEQSYWIRQRLQFAKELQSTFTQMENHEEFAIMESTPFYFYERTDASAYADLYSFSSARPAFRIKKDVINDDPYPLDQGMAFMKKIESSLEYTYYEPHLMCRCVTMIDRSDTVRKKLILNVLGNMKKRGYIPDGDIFLFLIASDENTDTLCINIPCRESD